MSTIAEEKPNTALQLINVEEAGTSIIASLNEALPFCQKLNDLAIKAFKPVLDTIEGEGMNAELDKQLNDLIIRADSAMSKMEAKRKPGTQMMSRIAKVFTTLENEIEAQKIIAQGYRNGWAKSQAEVQKKKEQEILKKQAVDKETIDVKAKVEQQIREAFQNKIYEFKVFYNNKLEQMTLESVDAVKKVIAELKVIYPREKFYEIPTSVTAVYLDKAALAPIIYEMRVSLYDELAATFKNDMEDLRQNLQTLIPSKVKELNDMKVADAAKKKEIEESAEKRRKENEDLLRKQSADAKAADDAKVNLNKQIETSGTLFNTSAELAELKEDTGKSRQGYKITVLSPAGWGAIFMFWFEKEGQSIVDILGMGKKTLDQMKSFCEKHAHKNNEKIVHDHVIYEEDYKAINTKDK